MSEDRERRAGGGGGYTSQESLNFRLAEQAKHAKLYSDRTWPGSRTPQNARDEWEP